MRRYMLAATMCAVLVLAMAPTAGAQTPSQDGCPHLPDGTPTVVNAAGTTCTDPNTGEIVVDTGTNPLSSPCPESSPGNIYTFEGGVCVLNGEAPGVPNTRSTPDGIQYSNLPDAIPTEAPTQYAQPMTTQYAQPPGGQPGPTTIMATGVLGQPFTLGQDPTPVYPLTDEATGTTFDLVSGFVDLGAFVGQRVAIVGVPVPGPGDPNRPELLNVTQIAPATGGAIGGDVAVPSGGGALPATGGLPLVPLAGALVLGLGVLGLAVRSRIS